MTNRDHYYAGRSVGGPLAAAFLLLVVCQAKGQVIYSEDFSSGIPLESLTDPQFGFTAQSGDMLLGPAEYGASGLAVNGALAAEGVDNELYRFINMGSHGLIEFSADLYVPTGDYSGVGIRLFSAAPFDPNHIEFNLGSAGYFAPWESSTYPAPRNLWDSPDGMHDEWVHASVFWNQDTGENWATVSDGSGVFASPHAFYSEPVVMDAIGLELDRRYSNGGSDIRDLRVERLATVPGPAAAGPVVAAACLHVRRMRRRLRVKKG